MSVVLVNMRTRIMSNSLTMLHHIMWCLVGHIWVRLCCRSNMKTVQTVSDIKGKVSTSCMEDCIRYKCCITCLSCIRNSCRWHMKIPTKRPRGAWTPRATVQECLNWQKNWDLLFTSELWIFRGKCECFAHVLCFELYWRQIICFTVRRCSWRCV